MKLTELRNRIDAVDLEIAELIARRTQLAREVGLLKTRAGLPVVDRHREIQVVERACDAAPDTDTRLSIRRVFTRIIEESRRIQKKVLESRIVKTKENVR